jgi:hypothetical protein
LLAAPFLPEGKQGGGRIIVKGTFSQTKGGDVRMRKQHQRTVSLFALAGVTAVTIVAGSGCGTSNKDKNGQDLTMPAKQPAGDASGYNNRPAGGGARPGSPPGPGGGAR